MADNNLDILIRFGLSKEKATEAIGEMKKIETQTKVTGTEGVKQEAAVEEATKKTTDAKNKFKSALKGLALEFPILGRIGVLAMNPIGGSIALLIAAFVALKQATANAQKNMAEFSTLNIKQTEIEKIEEYSTRFNELAGSVSRARTELGNLQSDIAAEAARQEALGNPQGVGPKIASANLATAAANKMRDEGILKMAQGEDVSDGTLATLRSAAENAQVALKDQEERTQFLKEYDAGKKSLHQIGWKFGFGTTRQEIAEKESRFTADAQTAISDYSDAVKRRDTFNEGRGLVNQAAAITSQNTEARTAIQTQTAADFKAAADAFEKVDVIRITQTVINMADAFQKQQDAFEARVKEAEQRAKDAASAANVARQRQ